MICFSFIYKANPNKVVSGSIESYNSEFDKAHFHRQRNIRKLEHVFDIIV